MIKNFPLMLAEIGKIKIGKKGEKRQSKSGGTYPMPTKLDHFLVTTLARDDMDNFIRDEAIMSHYGDKPRELDIMLISDDIDVSFPTSYALYTGKTCKCRGDGEKAIRVMKDGSKQEIECNPETCPFYQGEKGAKFKCKLNGVLNCLLTKSSRLGGVYKFRTTSFHSIRNILSSLAFIQKLTGNRIAFIPLKLTLSEKTAEVNGNKNKIHVVNVEFRGTANQMLENVLNDVKTKISFQKKVKMLELNADTFDESPDDAEDIVEEFYPEAQEGYPETAKAKVLSGETLETDNVNEVVDTETGEIKTTEVSKEDAEKAKKKEHIKSLKAKAEGLYEKLNASTDDIHELNMNILGVDFVSKSRSADKLNALIEYLEDMISSNGDENEGEEL